MPAKGIRIRQDGEKQVVIVGGGFAGLNALKRLSRSERLQITLVDRRNHHLFQPLLYQVAMAGLSPAEIAVPIRSLFSSRRNVRVIQGEVTRVDPGLRSIDGDFGRLTYDYLLLAAGAQHTYFGNEGWEPYAPGLKTLEQATEIRRRVLTAFEVAERDDDPETRRRHLTFVIVGGGPTGVELAGAIGEMSRFTLARDFRNIDPKLTRVILIEAGPRILPSFDATLASRATRNLEALGVQVWTHSLVSAIDAEGVEVGGERIRAATVLWAAGVQAASLGRCLGAPLDRQGRVKVEADLSVPGYPTIFVAGDQAHLIGPDGQPLPGIAPVAMQQGQHVARNVLDDLAGRERKPFRYFDKGSMATIGRRRAIVQVGKLRMSGFGAWLLWLFIHIYYLSGFKNRLVVLIQWAWSYLTFARGARLIVDKTWQSYASPEAPKFESDTLTQDGQKAHSKAGH